MTKSKKTTNTKTKKTSGASKKLSDLPQRSRDAGLSLNSNEARRFIQSWLENEHGSTSHGAQIATADLYVTAVNEKFMTTVANLLASNTEHDEADLQTMNAQHMRCVLRNNSELNGFFNNFDSFNPQHLYIESTPFASKGLNQYLNTLNSRMNLEPSGRNFMCYMMSYMTNRLLHHADLERRHAKKASFRKDTFAFALRHMFSQEFAAEVESFVTTVDDAYQARPERNTEDAEEVEAEAAEEEEEEQEVENADGGEDHIEEEEEEEVQEEEEEVPPPRKPKKNAKKPTKPQKKKA